MPHNSERFAEPMKECDSLQFESDGWYYNHHPMEDTHTASARLFDFERRGLTVEILVPRFVSSDRANEE